MVKKAVVFPDYEPFGEELSVEVAYLQAAALLDLAGKYAVEFRDIERLENVSVLWMELGNRMMRGAHLHEEEEEEEPKKHPLGFRPNGIEEEDGKFVGERVEPDPEPEPQS